MRLKVLVDEGHGHLVCFPFSSFASGHMCVWSKRSSSFQPWRQRHTPTQETDDAMILYAVSV